MLTYLLILGIAYGIAHGITSTGPHLWRAIVGFALAFVVAWFGGSLLGTFLITWMKWGDANSLLPIIGKGFWWALFGAGVGVNRAKHKLRTGETAPPLSIPTKASYLGARVLEREGERQAAIAEQDQLESLRKEGERLAKEARNERTHSFEESNFENEWLEQGCSKEAIDYLKNPIHIYSYMQKYKKTEGKILEAIKKGKLRGCYVGDALWVENKRI